jgi:hypothetical protein
MIEKINFYLLYWFIFFILKHVLSEQDCSIKNLVVVFTAAAALGHVVAVTSLLVAALRADFQGLGAVQGPRRASVCS